MITGQLMGEVANYINNRVTKVILNGAYEITDFEQKAVSGQTLALNYIIPAAQINHLTLIELRDANDTLLTSNAVDVPISVDTLFLQTIEIKEVP